ncbi:cytochrome P450 [Daedalea quercina L-15889]|uniref:Cytochrome P450 n=1 Tax=Daedalea quercina L-15889 TaxID=1314783 RepID=A0A165NZ60_9APHY|nr:cytochrome P450 [Daedalea quercina L-15889]
MILPSTTTVTTALCGIFTLWVLLKVVQYRRRRAHWSTPLSGPPSPSLLWGVSRLIQGNDAQDPGSLFEEWSEQYGSVFRIPAAFGTSKIVVCDPKAIQHFYSREAVGYVHTTMFRTGIESLVGRGVLWAQGDVHKRQRKALTPAFSNAAIRRMTSHFYDSAYKVKAAWDSILEAEPSGAAVIDVDMWMHNVSLDSIGITGFSHDFGTLVGKPSAIAEAMDDLVNLKSGLMGGAMLAIVGLVFPWVLKLPSAPLRLVNKINVSMGKIAQELLEDTRKEGEGQSNMEDRSIIDLLIEVEKTDSDLHMSEEDVVAQMKTLMMAAYETTAISFSRLCKWCLLELCRHPEIQQKLREELLSHSAGSDPTWDQLTSGLPYLDAVIQEALRIHPPFPDTERVAAEDDVLPLSRPMKTADGTLVDSIAVPKGAVVLVPGTMMNKATMFWGPDGKEFKPERWLDAHGIPARAQEIQGHRHILTFVDGIRICLGRHFAVAELKAVLSVLIRNYTFEFRDGPDTKTETKLVILPRPRIAGEEGTKIPLKVRRVE